MSETSRCWPNIHSQTAPPQPSAAVRSSPSIIDRHDGLETSRPRDSHRVAFISFPNVRSLARHCWLVPWKFDHFTAPATRGQLYPCRKEISKVEFDHFRHTIIPFTRSILNFSKSATSFDAVWVRAVSHIVKSTVRCIRLVVAFFHRNGVANELSLTAAAAGSERRFISAYPCGFSLPVLIGQEVLIAL